MAINNAAGRQQARFCDSIVDDSRMIWCSCGSHHFHRALKFLSVIEILMKKILSAFVSNEEDSFCFSEIKFPIKSLKICTQMRMINVLKQCNENVNQPLQSVLFLFTFTVEDAFIKKYRNLNWHMTSDVLYERSIIVS